jgi:hypothetical protein
MEVTNISAQLFNKQLKPDELASYYGCYNSENELVPNQYLTTCVNYVKSDEQLENTFQKQLDLSDYYKGRSVFEEIKKDFIDKTMGNENILKEELLPLKEPKITSYATQNIPVGPRDNLFNSIKKEFFGKGSSGIGMNLILFAVLVFIILIILINIK